MNDRAVDGAPRSDDARTGPDSESGAPEPSVTGADGGSAGRRRARPHWSLFVGLAVAVLVVDQAVKAWVVAGFAVGAPVDILGEYLRIAMIHNTGALFGMFRDQAPVFAAVSVAVIGVIVWYHAQVGSNPLLAVALGLLLGGAVGNFVDRIRLGYVVDFVDMGLGAWRFYTYNVADSAITVAILLLLATALLPGLAARFGDG